jgi:hypothetical protein
MISPAMQYLAQVTQPTSSTPDFSTALAALSGTTLIVAAVAILFAITLWFMVFKRTGMNPWLSLLMFVPLVNLVMLIILAFTEWPIQREVKALRAQLAGGGSYTPPGYAPPPAYAAPPAPPYNTQIPPPPPPPATT